MPKQRVTRTPLQRRAAFRLAALAKSRGVQLNAQPAGVVEARGPAAAALAIAAAVGAAAPGRPGRGRKSISAEIPAALVHPDPLPVVKPLPLGKKLENAINRLDAFTTPLDLLEVGE